MWKINFQFRGGTRGKTSTPERAGKSWRTVRGNSGKFFEEEKKEIITRRPGFARLFLLLSGGNLRGKCVLLGRIRGKEISSFFVVEESVPRFGFPRVSAEVQTVEARRVRNVN